MSKTRIVGQRVSFNDLKLEDVVSLPGSDENHWTVQHIVHAQSRASVGSYVKLVLPPSTHLDVYESTIRSWDGLTLHDKLFD